MTHAPRACCLPLAALLLVLAGCTDDDPCTRAPVCEEEESATRAINCEPSCTVGPCSNGAQFQTCAENEACTIVPGDINSARFFRSRALCVQGTASCDPTTTSAPVCDGQGMVMGCSAYRRVIRVSCAQAGLYFENPACCRGTGGTDGGTDGGTGADGGVGDGGTDGGR